MIAKFSRKMATRVAAGAVAAAMLMGAAAPAFALDPKVSDLNNSDKVVQLIIKTYLSGVWNGVSVTDAILAKDKKPRLVCQPEDYAPSDDEIVAMVQSFVSANKDAVKDDYNLSIVAVFAFKTKFPCS